MIEGLEEFSEEWALTLCEDGVPRFWPLDSAKKPNGKYMEVAYSTKNDNRNPDYEEHPDMKEYTQRFFKKIELLNSRSVKKETGIREIQTQISSHPEPELTKREQAALLIKQMSDAQIAEALPLIQAIYAKNKGINLV